MRLVLFILVIAGAKSTGKETRPQIYSLHVQSDIHYRYAHTLVTSKIANPSNFSQEVTFTVVLPETAFISGFLIEDGDAVYTAYVKEKKAAKKEYAEGVKNGRTAAHVFLRARNSNLFAVTVNVRPLKKVTFNLTYEELLTRKLGVYKHVINLDPGQIVQDLSVQVNIQEFSRISCLEVPAFKTGNDIFGDPNQDVGPSPLARILRSQPYTAVVRWEPTPEQQEELAIKGVRGQLVVKYDVDREQYPQQILVNDGYFVHFFAPPDLPPLQKHVIFVLDVSGSMTGRKIRQLKEAMNKTLGDLRPTDYFSLVRFSGKARVWDSSCNFYTLNKNTIKQNPVMAATEKNIERAKMVVNTFFANGGTNVYKALKTALQITKTGKRLWKAQNTNAGSRQQNRNPEPMIIFLTDGEPTEGKTNPHKIVTGITSRNKKVKASIFCLALGKGADFDFLKTLSLRNSGFARKIYEASDTAIQLTDFYGEVASPLLANVTFKYLTEQIDPLSLTEKQFYFFYSGSELVVSGHLQPTTPGDYLQYEVKALSPEGPAYFQPPSHPVVIQYQPLEGVHSVGLMERLWAYLSIQQLLDRAYWKTSKGSNFTKQALDLALKYSFVTPLTSLVVVKPDGTSKQAESVKNVGHNDFDTNRRSKAAFTSEETEDDFNMQVDEHNTAGDGSLRSSDTSFRNILFKDFEDPIEENDCPLCTALNARYSSLVDFYDIDWLGAFTIEAKILLPFGANNSVEVLGPHLTDQHQKETGSWCLTPEGEMGYCKHLRVCPLSTFKQNFTAFLEYFCPLEGKFAGSCCPNRLITQTMMEGIS